MIVRRRRRVTPFHDTFRVVDSDFPCPICGGRKWCAIHKTGEYVLCQKVESDTMYGKGAGYRHDLAAPIDVPSPSARSDGYPDWRIQELAVLFRKRRPAPRLFQLAENTGIPAMCWDRLTVGWDEDVKAFTIPMRNGASVVVGLQYRNLAGRKWSLKGSSLGLFIPTGPPEQVVYIAEGASDCAALLSLGLFAIGRPSCNTGKCQILHFLAARRPAKVVVVSDPNDPGRAGTMELLREIQGFDKIAIVPTRHKDTRCAIIESATRYHVLHAAAGGSNEFFQWLKS